MGLARSQGNACLFMMFDEIGELELPMSCHVDDSQIAGNPDDVKQFNAGLQDKFIAKNMGPLT